VYGVEDLYDLLEIAAVGAYNQWLLTKQDE